MLMKIKCGNGKFPILFPFCGKYFGVEIDLKSVRIVYKVDESSRLVKATTNESVICSIAWKSNLTVKCTVQTSTHNTAQLFGQFG